MYEGLLGPGLSIVTHASDSVVEEGGLDAARPDKSHWVGVMGARLS